MSFYGIILATLGALFNSSQLTLEKYIFKHHDGNINDYVQIKNIVMLIGFIILLYSIKELDIKWLNMNGNLLSSPKLIACSIGAGILAIGAVYFYMIGLKYFDIGYYALMYSVIFIVLTVLGSIILGEKINKKRAFGVIFSIIAIWLINDSVDTK